MSIPLSLKRTALRRIRESTGMAHIVAAWKASQLGIPIPKIRKAHLTRTCIRPMNEDDFDLMFWGGDPNSPLYRRRRLLRRIINLREELKAIEESGMAGKAKADWPKAIPEATSKAFLNTFFFGKPIGSAGRPQGASGGKIRCPGAPRGRKRAGRPRRVRRTGRQEIRQEP